MEGTIIWQRIQKFNKKLWRHNLIGIALLLGLGCSQHRYLYNCFLGAQKINAEQLFKLKDVDRIDREFVTFTSSRMVDTGITKVTIDRKTNIETVDSKYAVAMLDRGRAILIEMQPQADLKSLTFTGKLSKIPFDTQEKVVIRLIKNRPTLKDKILPVMLESADYKSLVNDLLFILAGGLGLCSWNLYKAKVRTDNPRKHPIYSSLLKYGDGDLLACNIDNEIKDRYHSQELEDNTLFLTPSWLLFTQIYNLQIVKLDRLIWAFKKVTNHSINFIPTGKTYAIVLYDRFGKKRNFSMSEREVDLIIQRIRTYAPWAVIGYTPESRKMWDWRRKEFYAMVEQRKQTSQSRSGTAHAAPKQEGKPKATVTVTTPRQEDKPNTTVTSPDRAAKVNEKAPSPDRGNSSDVRPDLNIDLNLGFYEAIFGCEPDIRVNRLEIQSNGEFAPTVKQLKIVVPAGSTTGTRLRLTGQGNLCTYGDRPGDLYLHLRVPFQADGLTREDDDIFTEVKITPAQAQAGVELRIRTLDGDMNLQIPPGSKHRSFLTLPGRGVPKRFYSFGRGDLVVWIEIEPSGKSATPRASATPKASADFDNIKSSLDGLAQLGWLQEESSWSANFRLDPSELSELDRLDRVVKALLDRARRVATGFSVPMMVPRVVVESMPAAAGQFEVDEEGWVTIRVSPDFERDLPAARAILAHEVCHYILEHRGIRQPNVQLNERDTDLCMFVCGFGDVFLAGYKRSSARNEYRPGHRLGYLTDAEYEFANRYTSELRATYRQNLQSELDVLKERLLRKAQGDLDRVRRLIEYERQRDRSLSELELYRDAIARFDRD
jgi:DnaJ-class molecular chaperone